MAFPIKVIVLFQAYRHIWVSSAWSPVQQGRLTLSPSGSRRGPGVGMVPTRNKAEVPRPEGSASPFMGSSPYSALPPSFSQPDLAESPRWGL